MGPAVLPILFRELQKNRWWWPMGAYWPEPAPHDETVDSFILAFRILGYSPCDEGTREDGFEKVAIYVDESDTPTHMARQLSSGMWISKCGQLEDIEHETLEALSGFGPREYGVVAGFLKRPIQ